MLIFLLLFFVIQPKLKAQAAEAEQLKLDIEKLLQLRSMLSNLQRGYEILNKGYNTIKNISEGNFNLHQNFLNSLLEVSPSVRSYRSIQDIVSTQIQLVDEYKALFRTINGSEQFSSEEIHYVANVYKNLIKESLNNLNALSTVITDGVLRMSDAERLSALDTIYKRSIDELVFFKHFSSQATVLALQRLRANNDVHSVKSMYGLK
ncbi:MAG: TerB family tellurite resistance protein [Flavisolibacter sp.]